MSSNKIIDETNTKLFLESIGRLRNSGLTTEQFKDVNFIVEFCMDEIAKSNKLVDSANDCSEKAVSTTKEAIIAFERIESKFHLKVLEQASFSGTAH